MDQNYCFNKAPLVEDFETDWSDSWAAAMAEKELQTTHYHELEDWIEDIRCQLGPQSELEKLLSKIQEVALAENTREFIFYLGSSKRIQDLGCPLSIKNDPENFISDIRASVTVEKERRITCAPITVHWNTKNRYHFKPYIDLKNFVLDRTQAGAMAQKDRGKLYFVYLTKLFEVYHNGVINTRMHEAKKSNSRSSGEAVDSKDVAVKSRIVRPPANRLRRLAEFIYTKRLFERIFAELFEDLEAEYFEALHEKRSKKASWIKIRGVLVFWNTVCFQTVVSLLKKLLETSKMLK